MLRKVPRISPADSAALGLAACLIAGTALASQPAPPALFAPGAISGPANDLSPAFSPDGSAVVFTRSNASYSFIVISHRSGAHWSEAEVAPFSGKWRDIEPAMAPDGSYLVFASNRPSEPGKAAIDGVFNGKTYPGGGGNLWRVERHAEHWGEPIRLPDLINNNSGVFSPSLAADGSLYFMQPDRQSGSFHIFRAAFHAGNYQAPQKMDLGDATTEEVDPAIAPDESFIVYSSRHPDLHDKNRLHIALRESGGWSKPQDLGDIVNEQGSNIEARLGPDHRTLYFSTNTVPPASPSPTRAEASEALKQMQLWANGNQNIWYVSLDPWLK